MGSNPFRQDRGEFSELIQNYLKFKAGLSAFFIDEEGFERIIDYYNEKESFQEAFEAAEFGCAQFPYSSSLLVKKADVLVSLRRYEESLSVLDFAGLFDGTDGLAYIIRTEALLGLDRTEEAFLLFEVICDTFDGEELIEVLFEVMDVYDDYEHYDKVFDALNIILKLEPNNEEALYKICFWTDYTGRNEESIILHQQLIEDNPFAELAWFNLGAAYQGIKLYEKAIDAYQYAVAIEEKFDYAYRNMGDAYIKLRKYKEAIEVLEKVTQLSRPESIIFEAIGHCFDKLKNYSQARLNYRKALHLNQEDSQLHYKIGCTYMGEENWTNAIKSIEQSIRIHQMQPEYNLALGRCYLQLQKYETAVVHLGNVVRVRPKSIAGWVELLTCLFEAELFEDGYEYAAAAFEQTSSKPIFLYYKSAFLFAAGQSKEGLAYLEYALNSNPKYIKQMLELYPSLLQNQQVVDLISRYKKNKKSRK
jgi:tetratricopeptide (TPR) repeat protein